MSDQDHLSQIVEALNTKGISVAQYGTTNGDDWIQVSAKDLRNTLITLKQNHGFNFFSFLSAVDHLPNEPRFEVVYQLRNLTLRYMLRIRCFAEGDPPTLPTVSDVYLPANWDEREMYDMFGIIFEGHPNLKRILMPDDWVGFPLRRDYPIGGEPVEFSPDRKTWKTPPPKA